jgi:hypothetical protein
MSDFELYVLSLMKAGSITFSKNWKLCKNQPFIDSQLWTYENKSKIWCILSRLFGNVTIEWSFQNSFLKFNFVKNLRNGSANENKDDLVILKTSPDTSIISTLSPITQIASCFYILTNKYSNTNYPHTYH